VIYWKLPSRKNVGLNPIFLHFHQIRIYVIWKLKYFLQRTFKIRTEGNPVVTKLFLTTQRPYKAVSRDTICRWTKNILHKSGIDVNIFKPHSTRAASTTAAFSSKVPLATILRTASWQKDCTFRKFNKKSIVVDKSFSENLLISYMHKNINIIIYIYTDLSIFWKAVYLEIEFINSKVSFKPEVPNREKKLYS
jgi:hypothetical protein